MNTKNTIGKAARVAFPKTLPIMTAFLFLGASYGVYATSSGLSFLFPLLMSCTVFGGSLEFVAVAMLLGTFAPLETFLVALALQARHVFYGISMLEKYRGMGKKKLYLIFGLCDETFSVNCSLEVPEGVSRPWCYFFVTLFDHLYWITGALLGGLLGNFIPFSTEGIEFVMSAMFTVIFLEEWLKGRGRVSALIGVLSSTACLLLFGKDSFLLPTLLVILALLSVARPLMKRKGGAEE